MKKNLLFIFCAIVLLAGCVQRPQLPTFQNTGNPLVKDKFTADPAPLVYDGTLYLYVGHDEFYEGQDTAHGGKEFNITEWLCYSTQDMQTWTDHGVVLKPTDFKWGIGEAWASQVIEHNGKFYYYTTVQAGEPYNSKAIGVAVGDTPTGPFTDAIGQPLVTDDMTSNGPRGWWNDIDPTALIDDNGQAWLCWGNGTCFLAKLKPNLTEIDGDIQVVDLPRYVEGPWLHKATIHTASYATQPHISLTVGISSEYKATCPEYVTIIACIMTQLTSRNLIQHVNTFTISTGINMSFLIGSQ